MAQPSQYQYVEVVGPVWTEPVSSRLAWLPQGNWQPARSLPRAPAAETWFTDLVYPLAPTLPPFDWQAQGRAAPVRTLPRVAAPESWFTELVFPPAVPSLDWQAQGRAPVRALPRAATPESWFTELVFPPPQLDWWIQGQPQPVRRLPRAPVADSTVELPRLPDPIGRLDWLPIDRYIGRALAPRQLVPSARDPYVRFLDWLPQEIAPPPRTLARARVPWIVVYPLPPAPPFDPAGLTWQSKDSYAGRARPFARQGQSRLEPPPVGGVISGAVGAADGIAIVVGIGGAVWAAAGAAAGTSSVLGFGLAVTLPPFTGDHPWSHPRGGPDASWSHRASEPTPRDHERQVDPSAWSHPASDAPPRDHERQVNPTRWSHPTR